MYPAKSVMKTIKIIIFHLRHLNIKHIFKNVCIYFSILYAGIVHGIFMFSTTY